MDAKTLAAAHGQEHVLAFLAELPEAGRQQLLDQLGGLDWPRLDGWIRDFGIEICYGNPSKASHQRIKAVRLDTLEMPAKCFPLNLSPHLVVLFCLGIIGAIDVPQTLK